MERLPFLEPGAPDRPLAPLRSIAGVVVFVVALLFGSLVVRRAIAAVPDLLLEEEGVPRIKAAHLAAHGDEYDVVLVGSSRTFRQLSPAVLEHHLAGLGRPWRVYNLGLPGMRFPEMLYTVERLLEQEPARLRWVVIELQDPDPRLRTENRLTRRAIAWHTPEITALACRGVLDSDRTAPEKAGELTDHVLQGLCRATNAGNAIPAAAALLGLQRVPQDRTPGGFLSFERDPDPSTPLRRAAFIELLRMDPGLLEERVRVLLEGPARIEPPDYYLRALERLVARVRAAGAEPVFVLLPPAERLHPEAALAQERGVIPHLLSYEDPDEYPDFYLNPRIRFDKNHLQTRGGTRLARLLADDLARLADAGEEGR